MEEKRVIEMNSKGKHTNNSPKVDLETLPGLMEIIESISIENGQQQMKRKKNRNNQPPMPAEESESSSTDEASYYSASENESNETEPEPSRSNNNSFIAQGKNSLKVHGELCNINKRLQQESKRLKNWDSELSKKETNLNKIQEQFSLFSASIKETVERETIQRCETLKQEYECKIKLLTEEARKSRESFNIIKSANNKFKTKISEDEAQLKGNKDKIARFQGRITNLVRKVELLEKQLTDKTDELKTKSSLLKEKSFAIKSINKGQNFTNIPDMFYETLSLLIQWIAEKTLKNSVILILKNENKLVTDEDGYLKLTNDKSIKIIMFMPYVISQVSAMSEKLQLPFIEFLYWSILHFNVTQSSQKTTHSATLRRIADGLYLHKTQNNSFYKSLNYNVRILSSLVILQSTNQADILVQIFQSLNAELKSELSKEFFLEIHATEMLLPLFKLTNKFLLGHIADILMIIIVDSPYMQEFLNQISTVEWIQSIITVLKASCADITLMENLSLILQRISKSKGVKVIFDVLQIKANITELLQLPSCEDEYLQLNLRSILLNIEAMKPKREKTLL